MGYSQDTVDRLPGTLVHEKWVVTPPMCRGSMNDRYGMDIYFVLGDSLYDKVAWLIMIWP